MPEKYDPYARKHRTERRGLRIVSLRKQWDKKTRKTHDKLDIEQYLAEVADRVVVDHDLIDAFKELHKNREFNIKKVGYRSRFIMYGHGSNPFCKVCDEDLVVGDEVYQFMLSRNIGGTFYHVVCFPRMRESRQRNIIYQDRAYKRKEKAREARENPPLEPLPDYIIDLREKSDKLSEELRKKHGSDV